MRSFLVRKSLRNAIIMMIFESYFYFFFLRTTSSIFGSIDWSFSRRHRAKWFWYPRRGGHIYVWGNLLIVFVTHSYLHFCTIQIVSRPPFVPCFTGSWHDLCSHHLVYFLNWKSPRSAGKLLNCYINRNEIQQPKNVDLLRKWWTRNWIAFSVILTGPLQWPIWANWST